ncbi:MAG: hypothetical protein ACKVRP_02355 [Bacteroidota bacterium]
MDLILVVIGLAALAYAALKFKFLPFGMAALAEDRMTEMRDGKRLSYKVAAAKKIYQGALVVLNSSGYAEPGTTATGKIALGRAAHQVDNSAGSNGDLFVDVEEGVFLYGNSTSTDEITIAEIGKVCWIADDQTVAKTSASGTRSVAGYVRQVDTDGVWVAVKNTASADGDLVAANNLSDVASAAIARANIGANLVPLTFTVNDITSSGALVARIVSPVAGTIKKIYSVITGALATGDATLTGKIGATGITNGVITITQSGSAAGDVDVATPTALNVVSIGDVISLTVGGTNTQAREAEITLLIET